MFLLVMCELHSPAVLPQLREAVEGHGPACHFFDSFFLVATDKSPRDLQTALHLCIDGKSFVYVSQLAHEHTGYLPKEVRDWMASHRESILSPPGKS